MFDKETKQKYLNNQSRCPNCDSYDLLAGPVNNLPRMMKQEIHCPCGESWHDVYTITNIEPIEESDDDVHGDIQGKKQSDPDSLNKR